MPRQGILWETWRCRKEKLCSKSGILLTERADLGIGASEQHVLFHFVCHQNHRSTKVTKKPPEPPKAPEPPEPT
eukprot:1161285-Pelagomonas_calceolata.AAC.3